MLYQCKPLTLYKEDGYRVHRDRTRTVRVERKEVYYYAADNKGEYWSSLTILYGYDLAYIGNRSKKLQANKKYAKIGKRWIERYKLLLASDMWEVCCDDWDGQGTLCPIQRTSEDGTIGCPIRFFFEGYSGSGRDLKTLPGRCDGPLNSSRNSAHVCAPSDKDEHGFSMNHFARIRSEIWKREHDY